MYTPDMPGARRSPAWEPWQYLGREKLSGSAGETLPHPLHRVNLLYSDSQPHCGVGFLGEPSASKSEITTGQKQKGPDSSNAVGGNSSMFFFFATHDKRCAELPFIQMLTCTHTLCPLRRALAEISMIFVSMRSYNPVLTQWLLLGLASPPNIFVKFKRGNLSDGWRLYWCVCRKIRKQH